MEALHHFLIPAAASRMSTGSKREKNKSTESPGRKNDESWDIDKALDFIEGDQAAPQTNKKAKKKKKKLVEECGEKVKQENTSPASHSGENTSDERANSDLLKDACKQRSVAVGEVVG